MILDADAVGRRAGMFAYWLCVVSKAHMVGTEGSLVRRREKEREERERERKRERAILLSYLVSRLTSRTYRQRHKNCVTRKWRREFLD